MSYESFICASPRRFHQSLQALKLVKAAISQRKPGSLTEQPKLRRLIDAVRTQGLLPDWGEYVLSPDLTQDIILATNAGQIRQAHDLMGRAERLIVGAHLNSPRNGAGDHVNSPPRVHLNSPFR